MTCMALLTAIVATSTTGMPQPGSWRAENHASYHVVVAAAGGNCQGIELND